MIRSIFKSLVVVASFLFFCIAAHGQEPDMMSIHLIGQEIDGAQRNVFSRYSYTVRQVLEDFLDIVDQTDLPAVIARFGGDVDFNPTFTDGDVPAFRLDLDYLLNVFPQSGEVFSQTLAAGEKSYVDEYGNYFTTTEPGQYEPLPYDNTYNLTFYAGRNTAAAPLLDTLENVEIVTRGKRYRIFAQDDTGQRYTIIVTGQGAVGGTMTGGAIIDAAWDGTAMSGDDTEQVPEGSGPYAITASAGAGRYVVWSGDCDQTEGNGTGSATCTIDAPVTADKNVTAHFAPIILPDPIYYTLTVTKEGDGSGTVSGGALGCGSVCSMFVEEGFAVMLSATPAPGSVFTGWSGACSGTGPCTVAMTSSKAVTAAFDLALAPIQGALGFAYDPVPAPITSTEPATACPMALDLGTLPGQSFHFRVGLRAFETPVDLYLLMDAPAIAPGHRFLFPPAGTNMPMRRAPFHAQAPIPPA